MADWYCPLPFRHAYVDAQGISACCQIYREYFGHQDLNTWPTNPRLIRLQQQMLQGQKPEICAGCHQQEALGQRSLRQTSQGDYPGDRVDSTLIDFVDYRASNICNFRCRSCEPAFSHGIASEVRRNPQLQKFLPVIKEKTVDVTDNNVQWITDNIGQIERLMFTGGEPTFMPETANMIRAAVDRNPNIRILITSNGSFQEDFWRDITLELPNIHWTLSLDAVGARAAIVRHGTDWSRVRDNAKWLAHHAPSLTINSVVSNLSVLGLSDLLGFVRDLQTQSDLPNGKVHQFYVIQRPNRMAVDNVPPEMITEIRAHLDQCRSQDLDADQKLMVESLIAQFQNYEFAPDLWQQSLEFNSILDDLRDENHLDLLAK